MKWALKKAEVDKKISGYYTGGKTFTLVDSRVTPFETKVATVEDDVRSLRAEVDKKRTDEIAQIDSKFSKTHLLKAGESGSTANDNVITTLEVPKDS